MNLNWEPRVLGKGVWMGSVTLVGLESEGIRSSSCECTWDEYRLLCRSEAESPVFSEERLVSWQPGEEEACSGSVRRSGGGDRCE